MVHSGFFLFFFSGGLEEGGQGAQEAGIEGSEEAALREESEEALEDCGQGEEGGHGRCRHTPYRDAAQDRR